MRASAWRSPAAWHSRPASSCWTSRRRCSTNRPPRPCAKPCWPRWRGEAAPWSSSSTGSLPGSTTSTDSSCSEPAVSCWRTGRRTTVLAEHGAALARAGVWVPGAPEPELPRVPAELVSPWETVSGAAVSAYDVSVTLTQRPVARRRTRTVALAPVDAALEAGRSLALTGPSGAGKSTLLTVLAGLRRPTQGRVVASHRPVTTGRHSPVAVVLRRPRTADLVDAPASRGRDREHPGAGRGRHDRSSRRARLRGARASRRRPARAVRAQRADRRESAPPLRRGATAADGRRSTRARAGGRHASTSRRSDRTGSRGRPCSPRSAPPATPASLSGSPRMTRSRRPPSVAPSSR